MRIDLPCRGCAKRSVGTNTRCHDRCQEYAAYRAKYEEFKQRIFEGSKATMIVDDYIRSHRANTEKEAKRLRNKRRYDLRKKETT